MLSCFGGGGCLGAASEGAATPDRPTTKTPPLFPMFTTFCGNIFFGEKYQSSSFARDKLGELGKVH